MSTATPGIPRPARATTTPRPALAEPGKAKVYGFPLELGTECLPPWAEMEQNIVDVNAGMIEFRLAAVPPADPLAMADTRARAGLAALVGGIRVLDRVVRGRRAGP